MTIMEERFARLLSYILHPLLLPTLSIPVILHLPTVLTASLPSKALIWLLITVFLFTCIIPAAATLVLFYKKKIESPELRESGERTLPLMISGISYMTLYYLTRNTSIPAIYLYAIYGSIMVLVAGMIISIFWKISLHMLGWGAATGALIAISIRLMIGIPLTIACVMVLSGLAGFARLKLNAHSEAQVYAGYATGVGIMLAMTLLL